MSCDLCNLEQKTKWHYEDDKIIICDCMTCDIPMVVLRRHTMKPTSEEIDHIRKISKGLFGDIMFRVDQRRIPDHLHWHLIKKEQDNKIVPKCKICNDHGFIIGEDHVTREICPMASCSISPVQMEHDSEEQQRIAMKKYKAKMDSLKMPI